MSNKPVVIIGAGCAGLSAAYQLQKKGIDYVLLEGSGRTGGRTGAVHFDPDRPESYYSYGAVFTEPNNATTFEYVKEFGFDDQYIPMDRKVYAYWLNDKVNYIVDDGNLFQSMMGLKGMPKAIIPQGVKFAANLAKAVKLIDGQNLDGLLPVSHQNTWDWTIENGGFEIADKLLAPMIQAMTAGSVRDTSAAHPIALLSGMQGMGQLKGSHALINDELTRRIGDNLHLNTKVEKIVIENGAVVGVKLENGDVIDTDYVLCCADAFDTIDMIPDAPGFITEALGSAYYSKIWQYIFTFDERFVPDDFVLLMLPPSGNPKISAIFDENIHDICGPAGSSVMHVYVPDWAADEFSAYDDETREQKVREEVARYYPQFLEGGKVVGVDYWQRGIHLEPAGQFAAIHDMFPKLQEAVNGLYLAGEYKYLVACTEGGYLTGKNDALAIAEQLGA